MPVAQVAAQGKDFNWIRPNCGCGHKKVWAMATSRGFLKGSPCRYGKSATGVQSVTPYLQ